MLQRYLKNTWQKNTDSPTAAMQLTIFLHSFEAPTGTFILSWRIGHLVGSTRGAVSKPVLIFTCCGLWAHIRSLEIDNVPCSCSDGCYEKDGLVEKLLQNIAFQEVAPVLPGISTRSVDNTPGEFAQIEKFRQKPFEFTLRSLTACGRKSQEIHSPSISANLCKIPKHVHGCASGTLGRQGLCLTRLMYQGPRHEVRFHCLFQSCLNFTLLNLKSCPICQRPKAHSCSNQRS